MRFQKGSEVLSGFDNQTQFKQQYSMIKSTKVMVRFQLKSSLQKFNSFWKVSFQT